MEFFRKKAKLNTFEESCRNIFNDDSIIKGDGIRLSHWKALTFEELQRLHDDSGGNFEIFIEEGRIKLSDEDLPSSEHILDSIALKKNKIALKKPVELSGFITEDTFTSKKENLAWAFQCLGLTKNWEFYKRNNKLFLVLPIASTWWDDLADLKQETMFGEIFLSMDVKNELINVYIEFLLN